MARAPQRPTPATVPRRTEPASPAGDAVRILYRGSFVEIAGHGRMLRAGRAGDVVPVRLENGRTIRAKIQSPGIVIPVENEERKSRWLSER